MKTRVLRWILIFCTHLQDNLLYVKKSQSLYVLTLHEQTLVYADIFPFSQSVYRSYSSFFKLLYPSLFNKISLIVAHWNYRTRYFKAPTKQTVMMVTI